MAKISENGNRHEQIVDFNKLRKRRQRFTTIKRLLILSGVVVLLLGAVFLNNILVQENVTVRISDLLSGMGGSGYPTALPGGVIKDVNSIGDNLAILNDANLYIYNSGGKQVANFQQMNDSTVLLVGGNRMMTYDANGKKFSIHSKSRTLEEQALDYAIITGAINDRGDYAIVSSSKSHICEINVYNKNHEAIFLRQSLENLVSTVSISSKGNMMATGWVNARDGVLYSGVDLYRLSTEDDPLTFELPDCLVLDVQYQEDDRIAVLTDEQYFILGADGRQRYSYPFDGRQLSAIEQEGRQTLLLLEDKETRRRDLVLLDSDLSVKETLSTMDKIVDMQLAARRVYLLWENTIVTYDHSFEVIDEYEVQHVSRIHLTGSRVYYLTREEIRVMGQTVADTAPENEVEEDDFFFDDDEDTDTGDAETAQSEMQDAVSEPEDLIAGAFDSVDEEVPI